MCREALPAVFVTGLRKVVGIDHILEKRNMVSTTVLAQRTHTCLDATHYGQYYDDSLKTT